MHTLHNEVLHLLISTSLAMSSALRACARSLGFPMDYVIISCCLVTVGDSVYSVQNRIGEGAFAKIYCVVPKTNESQSSAARVVKVCFTGRLYACLSALSNTTTPQPPQPHLITDDGLE